MAKKRDIKPEIDSNLRIALSAKKGWKKEATEDIEFALGEQWSRDDKSKLEEAGRPVLTFNQIKPMVNLVTGHLIQNNARIDVAPEGGEDETFSSIADRIISHIHKRS
jgi:hypothetical protein